MTFPELFADVQTWSAEKIGPGAERGPVGPLKHMAVEILAELLPDESSILEVLQRTFVKREKLKKEGKVQDPTNITEQADLAILLCDIAWRSGHTDQDLTDAGGDKMVVNKARYYPPMTGDGICEHVASVASAVEIARDVYAKRCYTLGLAENYDAWIHDPQYHDPDVGMYLSKDVGGTVFRLYTDALVHCPMGYSVYGVLADFDTDAQGGKQERQLRRKARIVQLTKEREFIFPELSYGGPQHGNDEEGSRSGEDRPPAGSSDAGPR